MSDESQLVVPRSFIELYLPKGAIRPRESRAAITERYEFCEDLVQMLGEQARSKPAELGVTEHDVLERIARGLQTDVSIVSADEAAWVMRRLAEVLEWEPLPEASAPLA